MSLKRPVLILNKHYATIDISDVRNSISLIYKNAADIIDTKNNYISYDWDSWVEYSQDQYPHTDYYWIECVSFPIIVPTVIKLHNYGGYVVRRSPPTKRNIFKRDKYQCQYCGDKYPKSQLSLDHVVPKSRGGSSNWDNLVCACRPCNAKKRNRTPKEANMELLVSPHEHDLRSMDIEDFEEYADLVMR